MDMYQHYARFYDALDSSESERFANLAQSLLETYAPQSKTVLELGCGTGTILKQLSNTYQVSGLDSSKAMLDIARKKLPDTPLFQTRMETFDLKQSYDAILCMYDSINHLPHKDDWLKTFKQVALHLHPNGYFIFDMNTVKRLLSFQSPHNLLNGYIYEFEDGLFTLEAEAVSNHQTNFIIRIFEEQGNGSYTLFEDTMLQTSFSVGAVKDMLTPYFTIETIVDTAQEPIKKSASRAVFVCRKKPTRQ